MIEKHGKDASSRLEGIRGLRERLTPFALLGSGLFLVGIMLLATFILLEYSFELWDPSQGVIRTFSLSNYFHIFTDPFFASSMLTTMRIAGLVTLADVILAYPLAYTIARTYNDLLRTTLTIVVLFPMLMDPLIRNLGWLVLFEPAGLVNTLTQLIGLGRFNLIFNEPSVIAGLTQELLPFMVLSLSSTFFRIPRSMEQQAQNLGASELKIFLRILLPLSVPGLLAGAILVFTIASSAFVTPLVLGGGNVNTITIVIFLYMIGILNWPLGSAISVVLIVLVILLIYLSNLVGKRWL